jgi:hypothetical protein
MDVLLLCPDLLLSSRLLPAVNVMSAVLHDPDIILQVMNNRNLSLW